MYPAYSMPAIIAEHVSILSSVSPKERLKHLASRLTDFSYAVRQCSLVLDPAYYCYVYLDPRKPGKFKYALPSGKVVKFDYEPYYVGKGSRGRLNDHVVEAKRSKKTTRKLNIIRKILAAGLEPLRIATPTRVDEALCFALEIDLIAGIGRHDLNKGPLANLDDGGMGVSGHRHTEAHKVWLSAKFKGRPGRPVSEQTKEKLRKARTKQESYSHTAESRKKVGDALRGRKHTAEAIEANRLGHLGMANTEEQKRKISATMKIVAAKPNSYTKILRTCPNCERSGRGPGFQRWHFDRCRANLGA